MLRTIIVVLAAIVLFFGLVAWQISVSTTLSGGQWYYNSTTGIPTTSTGYVSICAPESDCRTGPCGMGHAPYYVKCKAVYGEEFHMFEKLCGGIFYSGALAITPNVTWDLAVWFQPDPYWEVDCGPAKAYFAYPSVSCPTN